ncbi:KGK domain-containing protein [Picosynechococcus sp. NKBG042902]|uniref:KGK domain-containing protein n=1 Tax=Picosynechococcus sp. NKBG042902 TaxID=490193 RepID=UPI0004AB8645|nr:KGK domain-containing protein [Picosynechococcus sp. NKBG042902]
MSENFDAIENVFGENTIFEINSEADIMKSSTFLNIIDEICTESLSAIENEIDNVFSNESIELQKIKNSTDNSIIYEIKSLIAEHSELVWKNKKIRFRLIVEASEDSRNFIPESPLDDIRQEITKKSEEESI